MMIEKPNNQQYYETYDILTDANISIGAGLAKHERASVYEHHHGEPWRWVIFEIW